MRHLSWKMVLYGRTIWASEGVRVIYVGGAVSGGSLGRGIELRSFVPGCLPLGRIECAIGGFEVIVVIRNLGR